MGDRLSEIKDRWLIEHPQVDDECVYPTGFYLLRQVAGQDVAGLIAEVERLRSELASLRDHPGGVDPHE